MVFRSKKKAVSAQDKRQQYGEVWVWLAIDPLSKLVVCQHVDDRTLDACRRFMGELLTRLTAPPLFTSDELGHYMVALWENYSPPEVKSQWENLNPSRRAELIDANLDYAVVHKERVNRRIVAVSSYVVYGDEVRIQRRLNGAKINTAFVERFNLTLRTRDAHLHRRSIRFAKELRYFSARLALVIAYYNCVKPHGTLSRQPDGRWRPTTPAQAAGLLLRPWQVNDLIGLPMKSQ